MQIDTFSWWQTALLWAFLHVSNPTKITTEQLLQLYKNLSWLETSTRKAYQNVAIVYWKDLRAVNLGICSVWIDIHGGNEPDICRRIEKARSCMKSLDRNIWRSSMFADQDSTLQCVHTPNTSLRSWHVEYDCGLQSTSRCIWPIVSSPYSTYSIYGAYYQRRSEA